MLNWIRTLLPKAEPEEEYEEYSEGVEENFDSVGVRVNRPPVAVKVKAADTYITGYNVDEADLGADQDQSGIVPLIHTTGIDPYDTGQLNISDARKAVRKK